MAIKLIVALDFADKNQALALVDQLNPASTAIKVGSEMFTLWGADFVRTLVARQFKVFLDLKFHDIPTTVARACAASADLGVWMINVHASGGMAMMQAAKQALETFGPTRPLLIAVTILTSMTANELAATGVSASLAEQVNGLAKLAKLAHLDGVVCSAWEVAAIKTICGPGFLTVTPGIRPAGTEQDDQSRVNTPQLAIKAGSDFLVVGRPITQAMNPSKVINDLLLTFNE